MRDLTGWEEDLTGDIRRLASLRKNFNKGETGRAKRSTIGRPRQGPLSKLS